VEVLTVYRKTKTGWGWFGAGLDGVTSQKEWNHGLSGDIGQSRKSW